MTNFEYHEQEIKDFLLEHGNANFAVKNDKIIPCGKECDLCENNIRSCCNRRKWLSDEHRQHYSIPINTPVDTKVLVSNDGVNWIKRYFSHFGKNKQSPYMCLETVLRLGVLLTSLRGTTVSCVERVTRMKTNNEPEFHIEALDAIAPLIPKEEVNE